MSAEVTDQGKYQAIASYLSLFTGWPLFLWPLVTRDDAFGLQHGKWAGGLYAGYFITMIGLVVFSFVTCGFGAFLIFLIFGWWIPGAMGVLAALNGKLEAPPLAEALAGPLFASITMKDGPPP